MRLLLLTPGELTRDPRASRAAATARKQGLEVVGLCLSNNGARAGTLQDVSVIRVPLEGPIKRGGREERIRRSAFAREAAGLYRLARFARRTLLLVRASRRLGTFDVVHANDLDTLPAAWAVRRRTGARLVYDAHELYSAAEVDPPRIYRAAILAVERFLGRRADAVVTTGTPYAQELESRLGLRRPPLLVLNCPPTLERDPQVGRGDGPIRAIYTAAGDHPGRPLADVIDAGAYSDGAVITIRVLDADEDALRQRIAARGVSGRVEVSAPVPLERIVEELVPFEVGLVINRPATPNDALCLPNKLFEYMMAGLAVVAPRLPALALVESEGIGLTFEPGDPRSLGAVLRELGSDRPRLLEMRQRARQLALDRYNADAQAPALLAAWGASGDAAQARRRA